MSSSVKTLNLYRVKKKALTNKDIGRSGKGHEGQ